MPPHATASVKHVPSAGAYRARIITLQPQHVPLARTSNNERPVSPARVERRRTLMKSRLSSSLAVCRHCCARPPMWSTYYQWRVQYFIRNGQRGGSIPCRILSIPFPPKFLLTLPFSFSFSLLSFSLLCFLPPLRKRPQIQLGALVIKALLEGPQGGARAETVFLYYLSPRNVSVGDNTESFCVDQMP